MHILSSACSQSRLLPHVGLSMEGRAARVQRCIGTICLDNPAGHRGPREMLPSPACLDQAACEGESDAPAQTVTPY